MATKTANLYARIEPDLKEQAEAILASLGVTSSNAITMFYKQIVLHRGLPFDVTLPSGVVIEYEGLSTEQKNAELQKGYYDMLSGNVKPAADVFDEIKKDYNV